MQNSTITKKHNNTNARIKFLVLTALMAAIVALLTFVVRIPIPATQGYIHLGDCMIFLSVFLLGWKRGAVTAAIGSALADIVGGYAFYAPISLVVKALMAVVAGIFIARAINRARSTKKAHSTGKKIFAMSICGMILGGLVMVAGYYIAESIMYGSLITPLIGVAMNCLQFAVGLALCLMICAALSKTSLGSEFRYPIFSDM